MIKFFIMALDMIMNYAILMILKSIGQILLLLLLLRNYNLMSELNFSKSNDKNISNNKNNLICLHHWFQIRFCAITEIWLTNISTNIPPLTWITLQLSPYYQIITLSKLIDIVVSSQLVAYISLDSLILLICILT